MSEAAGRSEAAEPPRPRVRLRHRVEYAAARVALGIVNALPERVAYGIAGWLGRTWFRFARERQRVALHFLRHAYPERADAELLRLARVATGNVFKVVLDTARLGPLIERGRLLERLDVSEARAKIPPGPFLAVSGHLGSWEAAGISVAALGREAHAIARRLRNPLLHEWITGSRRRAGLHLHPRRGGLRHVARAMKRGGVGLQVIDQYQRLRGVTAPFFGEPVATERAAATLAVRRGYPIVVGSCLRTGPGLRLRMRVSDPYLPPRTGDVEADVREAVAELNRRLEEHIRHCPEQYLWLHDRYHLKGAERRAAAALASGAAGENAPAAATPRDGRGSG